MCGQKKHNSCGIDLSYVFSMFVFGDLSHKVCPGASSEQTLTDGDIHLRNIANLCEQGWP